MPMDTEGSTDELDAWLGYMMDRIDELFATLPENASAVQIAQMLSVTMGMTDDLLAYVESEVDPQG